MFAVHQTINGINHFRQIIIFCIVTIAILEFASQKYQEYTVMLL